MSSCAWLSTHSRANNDDRAIDRQRENRFQIIREINWSSFLQVVTGSTVREI